MNVTVRGLTSSIVWMGWAVFHIPMCVMASRTVEMGVMSACAVMLYIVGTGNIHIACLGTSSVMASLKCIQTVNQQNLLIVLLGLSVEQEKSLKLLCS